MELATSWLEVPVGAIAHEVMLFASIGILILGLDDIFLDILWFATSWRQRRKFVAPQNLDSAIRLTGPLAIFLPAWDESDIIAATLHQMLAAWDGEDFRIYVGCYPNDSATLFAVSPLIARDHRLRLVIANHAGPTTKGDNLNQMWTALRADERAEAICCAGVVLHDAEDEVHHAELSLYRTHLVDHAMVQIPVLPALTTGPQWIAGHYGDEFAESHGKEMVLRSCLGLPLPSAGVGCALTRDAVLLLAVHRGGLPFRADSLTEDYEVGILVGAYGLRAAFIDARGEAGDRIVSRGPFPDTLEGAVRQKSRWIAGIAFASWDHLGWVAPTRADRVRLDRRQWLARWMLWRDRRAPLAAIVLLAAYASLLFMGAGWIGRSLLGWRSSPIDDRLGWLVVLATILLVWRLGMRAHFTARSHGLRQAFWSVPRVFMANIVAMLAARRALWLYCRMLRSGEVIWDKTTHQAARLTGTTLESASVL